MTNFFLYAIPLVAAVGFFIFQEWQRFSEEQERQNQRQRRGSGSGPSPSQKGSSWTAPPNGTCTICQDDYELGINTEKMRCGHVFHRSCYRKLLESTPTPHPKCPNCLGPIF